MQINSFFVMFRENEFTMASVTQMRYGLIPVFHVEEAEPPYVFHVREDGDYVDSDLVQYHAAKGLSAANESWLRSRENRQWRTSPTYYRGRYYQKRLERERARWQKEWDAEFAAIKTDIEAFSSSFEACLKCDYMPTCMSA